MAGPRRSSRQVPPAPDLGLHPGTKIVPLPRRKKWTKRSKGDAAQTTAQTTAPAPGPSVTTAMRSAAAVAVAPAQSHAQPQQHQPPQQAKDSRLPGRLFFAQRGQKRLQSSSLRAPGSSELGPSASASSWVPETPPLHLKPGWRAPSPSTQPPPLPSSLPPPPSSLPPPPPRLIKAFRSILRQPEAMASSPDRTQDEGHHREQGPSQTRPWARRLPLEPSQLRPDSQPLQPLQPLQSSQPSQPQALQPSRPCSSSSSSQDPLFSQGPVVLPSTPIIVEPSTPILIQSSGALAGIQSSNALAVVQASRSAASLLIPSSRPASFLAIQSSRTASSSSPSPTPTASRWTQRPRSSSSSDHHAASSCPSLPPPAPRTARPLSLHPFGRGVTYADIDSSDNDAWVRLVSRHDFIRDGQPAGFSWQPRCMDTRMSAMWPRWQRIGGARLTLHQHRDRHPGAVTLPRNLSDDEGEEEVRLSTLRQALRRIRRVYRQAAPPRQLDSDEVSSSSSERVQEQAVQRMQRPGSAPPELSSQAPRRPRRTRQ